MARKNATAERTRLEDELKTIRRSRGEFTRAEQEAARKLEQLEADRRRKLGDVARQAKGAEGAVAETDAAISETKAEARNARERREAADKAARGTERTLKAHIHEHLGHFIAGADKLSDKAVKDREAVLDGIAKAQASEAEARAEWIVVRNAARANGTDLGALPDEVFRSDLIQRVRQAPKPEPARVRQARKRGIVGTLADAVRSLLDGGAKPTPPKQDKGRIAEVIE